MNNINYSFIEEENQSNFSNVTYEDLLENVNSTYNKLPKEELSSEVVDNIGDMINDFYAQQLNYDENYTLKQLGYIADYYEISKRKNKRKADLIEAIVIFENNAENSEIVSKRAMLWEYMEEIKADKYLSKFLIFE